MEFLTKAAKLYQNINPDLSSRMLREMIQISEKKVIRM